MTNIIINLLGSILIVFLLILLGILVAGGLYLLFEYIEFVKEYYEDE